MKPSRPPYSSGGVDSPARCLWSSTPPLISLVFSWRSRWPMSSSSLLLTLPQRPPGRQVRTSSLGNKGHTSFYPQHITGTEPYEDLSHRLPSVFITVLLLCVLSMSSSVKGSHHVMCGDQLCFSISNSEMIGVDGSHGALLKHSLNLSLSFSLNITKTEVDCPAVFQTPKCQIRLEPGC